MASIGIMGGTFNPIHIGHITIARAAYEQYYLDEVWFMPNHIPAYKSEDSIVSGEERLEMVRIAIQDIPYCKASDFEIKRDGNTYTIDTLRLLKKQYPNDSFYFIMGSDSLFDFHKWRESDSIPKYANMLVAPRNEKSKTQIAEKISMFNAYYGMNCFGLIDCAEIPCSSSGIRDMLSQFQNRNLLNNTDNYKLLYLPKDVYLYIIQNHFYLN